ncbi:flavin reductase [Testudinibacter aquarius]|nr:flavin reductase [Testudinibacter aquarius]KAE9527666.1 hypothetical protein A1D24_11035 [Testudinibacter aquarius]TNG93628.1 4-hydroxyphenylacetate 3-monooxygenase [Testudinibacter aquarius]
MANLASAVSILTSAGTAGTVGLTVSSVSSVTDSPATLLVCINQGSELHDIVRQNRKVAINILNASQQELALHFAAMGDSSMQERLAWEVWQHSEHGAPILKQALAILEGEIVEENQIGTHSVFFVRIERIKVTQGDALIYFNRTFHRLPFRL